MNNIVTLQHNHNYRLGDLIYSENNFIINHFIKTETYKKFPPESIAFKYIHEFITNPPQNNKIDKTKLITRIITELTSNKSYKLPDENTLVVHLRLGDVFSYPISDEDKFNNILKDRIPNLDYLIAEINKSQRKNLVIVTAFHYGIAHTNLKNNKTTKFQDNTSHISKKFFNMFIQNIPKRFNVSIQSSENIDEDFIYLCYANELILSSGSLFGIYAKNVNYSIKYPNQLTMQTFFTFPHLENKIWKNKVKTSNQVDHYVKKKKQFGLNFK